MTYPATTALDYVRQATVHITSKRQTGTGFFIDRNIVLTCAHVLTRGVDEVQIRAWAQGAAQTVTGVVLKRLPESGKSKGEAYPFPDIAFVGVDGNLDLPIAETHSLLLHHVAAYKRSDQRGVGNNRDAKLLAFGYNRQSPEPDRGPDVLRLAVQGPDEPYVKAQSMVGVVPGMSGAPIVDESTGLVAGMLKYAAPGQSAAWFLDALDFEEHLDRYRNLLGLFEPRKPRLFLPERDTPLWTMLNAQRTVAEQLPYQVVKGKVPLSTVYVEQRASAWLDQRRRAAGRGGKPPPLEPVVIPASEMLTRHRNALVVGGPGGGKSTLLQHAVAESVDWWLRSDQPAEGEEPPFGPAVAIRCAATRLLSGRPWYDSIADAVNADLHSYLPVALKPDLFERPPRPGVDWLVLVDGLDEIFDPRKRAALIDILATNIATYGQQARFLVSSRNLADSEFRDLRSRTMLVDRTQRLGEYNLRPFDRTAVESFAGRWYRLREPDLATERQRTFLEQVDRNRMMAMVSIPLLCTIAADVHQQNPGESLPYGRAGLYQRFVGALLTDRPTFPDVRTKLLAELHDHGAEVVAFGEALFSRRRGCLEHLAERRMERESQPSVRALRAWLSGAGLRVPDEFNDDHFREFLVSTGLIVNRGDGLEFIHQSFAEFLYAQKRGPWLEPDEWLARVTTYGLKSVDLFELAIWTEDGNDPTPLILALAAPGPDRQFPQLSQLADLLADGAATIDDGSAIAAITMEAVQEAAAEPQVLVAVNQAAQAFLQRAPDTSPLVELIDNPATPEQKRIEIATVFLADADVANRRHGLRVLTELGYSARRKPGERLPALRALAESGRSAERRSAVQHLASLVKTGPGAPFRVTVAEVLIGLGEPAEALAAAVSRLTDHSLTSEELQSMPSEVEAIADLTRRWVRTEGGEPDDQAYNNPLSAEVAPWTPPKRITGAAGRSKVDTLSEIERILMDLSGRVHAGRLAASVSALIHDRSLDWSVRSLLSQFASEHGLGLAATDELLDDSSVDVTRRLFAWYAKRHSGDPAGTAAALRSIVRNERADAVARTGALNILSARGGASGAAFLTTIAEDRTISPAVRIESALLLARHPDTHDEGLAALDALGGDESTLSARWRLAARTARVATRLDSATVYLTTSALNRDVNRVVWAPWERFVDRLSERMRRARS